MAKYGKSLAQVVVEINGKQQVQQVLKAMEESAEKLRNKIAATKEELEKLAEGGTTPEYTEKMKELKGMEQELKQTERALNETKKLNLDINDVLANMSEYSAKVLANTKRRIEATLRSMKPVTEEQRQQMLEMQKDVQILADEINHRLGKLTEFEDIMNRITHVDDRSLEAVIKRLKELIATTDKLDADELIKLTEQLDEAEGEKRRRVLDEGRKTLIRNQSSTYRPTTEIAQADIKALEEYKKLLRTDDSEGLKKVNDVIDRLKQNIKETESGFISFDEALAKAKQVSEGSFKGTQEELERIKKALEEGIKTKLDISSEEDNKTLKETLSLLDGIADKQKELSEINQREKAAEVMQNPMAHSVDELNEAIKLTEKLQSATNDTTVWNNYEAQLVKAREARDRFADESKHQAMVKQFESLADLSVNAYAEQKKYWEGMRDSGKYYDEAIEKLAKMQQLEEDRMKSASTETLSTNLHTAGTEEIKQSVDWLTKYQATLEPLGEEWNDINELIQNGEARLKSIAEATTYKNMVKQFENLKDLSVSALAEQQKYWEKTRDEAGADIDLYNEAIERLKAIKAQQDANLKKQADNVMGGDYTKTVEGTKQAIELLKKYQQTLDATDTRAINEVEASIKRMNGELDKAQKASARKTLTADLQTAGTADIKQAVDWLTKYQGTLKPLSPLWKTINKEIEAGNNRLKELSDKTKMDAMIEQFKSYKTISVSALADQKKYWTEVKNTFTETDTEYKKAVARLDMIDKLEKERTKTQAKGYITQATSGNWDKTIEETQQAIKLIEEYKKQLHVKTDAAAITTANQAIEKLNESLGKGKEAAMSFQDALAKARTITNGGFDGTLEDLAKIKKAIEEGMNTKLNLSDDEDIKKLKEAQRLLEDIAKEQREAAQVRLEEQAKATQDAIKNGSYKGTIEETEKAIELQKQYMKLLDDTDAAGIKTVEETIEALQNRLKKAKDELMDYSTAMKQVEQIQRGTWKGTIEDLDKIKKSLEYHKKNKLELGDKESRESLKEIEKALRDVDKAAKGANMSMADIDALLKRLDSASVEELEIAAKNLQEQLHDATRGVEDYAKTAAKLREVNQELKKAKKEWEGQENVIVKTTKRLMAYVAVYGGFNEIIGKMKEVVQLNLQLSDSLADVQKTTGLTGIELQELGRSLERIDTRTATTELYQLAAAAGQIGLKTQEDVLGFAKAANTISVALNELGAEGSATIAKIATLTGDVARSGTEQALLKVGSAINELTANSAATAGPIADFISRVGGIASSANIAIHEMAALGAATDASAQSIEIAGTSMNKFITALVSNTENIAYATNLNARELQTLINEGNTMQAVIRVLESMQTMDRGGISAAMKELGSEGARMNQYVASMVSNLDMLKAQLAISKEAFDENVSVINEYNVKQESALGILQRMKNSFLDTFVNSKMTVILKDILQMIAAIPDWLEKHRTILLGIRIVLAQIFVLKLPMLLSALMKQLSGMYALLSGPVIASVKSFGNAWKQARFQVYMAARQTGASVAAATVATQGFSGALKTLWALISANPVGLLVSAIAAGVAIWYHFREETDEVAKATAELTKKHTRQIEELNALRTALEATNTSYAVKAAAMREINSLYSKYLGFELSELDTYEKKKAALDYINAKLKENQTLELATRQKEVYSEEFNKDTEKSMENIAEALMSIPEIGAKRLTEAMNVMNEAIKNGATTAEEVMAKLSEHFKTDVEFDDDEWGLGPNLISIFTDTNLESLENYVEKYATLQQQLAGTDEYFNGQKIENQRISDEALEQLAVAHQNKIAAIEANHQEKLAELQKQGSAMTEAEQIAHLQTLLKEQQEYQQTAEKLLQRAREEDEKYLASQTDKDTGIVNESMMTERYGGSDNWKKVRSQIAAMNEMRREMERIKKELTDNENKLTEAQNKYEIELAKENNDEQIALAKQNVEERAKLQNDLNVKLIQTELNWKNEYSKLQTDAASKTREEWGKTVEEVSTKISMLNTQIAGDPWGKMFNLKDWKEFPKFIEGLEDASVVSLVEGFKKLRDNTKLITKDVEGFNKMFELETPLKSLDEVNTQVFDWLNQIRRELKNRNRGITGEMLWGNPKEEMEFILNTVQTYYTQRQSQIRKAYIDGMITNEEMKRRLDDNNNALLEVQIQFRRMMLGQQSTFTEMFIPGLEGHDLAKLRTEIRILGDEVTDEIEKELAKDEDTMAQGAQKWKEAFEKELLANDPFGTLRESFRSSLDSLKLMSSEYERDVINKLRASFPELTEDELGGLTEEKMQERLDFLLELSQKSYTVDRDGLRKMFDNHQEYYAWVDKLDDQQMDVMLAKLQWFYDESLVKQKAYADKLIKAQESAYEQEGLKYDDVAKLQWERQNLINKRAALQSQNTLVSNDPVTDPKERAKIESEIAGHTQAINRLDEQILEAQKKAADKSKSLRNKKEREVKEEMEASISALDAYYNEMEALIRKRGLERNLTEEEIERQIIENSVARQKDMIQLRKKLLGDPSTFDPNANGGYKGAITGTVFFGENKTEEMLQTQAQQIKVWGKALMDGMRNQIAKSEIDIQKEAQKLRETIQKILLDKQYVQQAVNEMRESFGQIDFIDDKTQEKLNFLWGDTEQTQRTQEAADARMKILQTYSEDVYLEEAGAFKERLKQDATFGETVKKMDEEEYAAFILLLQQYHDKVISAEKRHADERKRIIDQVWEEEGYQSGYDAAERTIGIAEENLNTMQNAGAIASEQEYFDRYQELVLDRVALEQWAYEQKLELYKKNNATQEQFQQLDLEHAQKQQGFQQQLLNNYIARYQKMADITTSYGNIIGDGFGRMIAGEEDAGKQLIKNLLTETIQMASQFAQRLILQSTFGAQMESIRASQNAAQLAAAYATAMSEVGIEASKMAAIEAIAAGEITAQSMAQPDSIVTWGGAGAARAAVIIGLVAAATAAALALVNSLFPDSKASETKNRKLSTGMLTYAEGNYPVLGNDGKVYDAKYEGSNIKTGVYGGGAHFGIFSEKQPEMIVDGKTTQKLILNYPYIYDAITTIAKNGRLVNAMPTFASGDYPAGMRQIAQVEAVDASGGANEQMAMMQEELAQSREVNRRLLKVLEGGLVAHVDGLENYKQQKKNERFLKRRGID